MSDPAAFIRANLRLEAVSGLDGIRLYTAHSGSRLSRLGDEDAAPYWAFAWAGGLALAHHVAAHPELVDGRLVLDLGSGSGLVAIAAARAGASVCAAEIDGYGRASIGLNADANGVVIPIVEVDLAGEAPAGVDVVLAGDVFYNAEVGAVMLPFLQRCAGAGLTVLVGDPGRRDLPMEWLEPVASYGVGDVGDAQEGVCWVYRVQITHRTDPTLGVTPGLTRGPS